MSSRNDFRTKTKNNQIDPKNYVGTAYAISRVQENDRMTAPGSRYCPHESHKPLGSSSRDDRWPLLPLPPRPSPPSCFHKPPKCTALCVSVGWSTVDVVRRTLGKKKNRLQGEDGKHHDAQAPRLLALQLRQTTRFWGNRARRRSWAIGRRAGNSGKDQKCATLHSQVIERQELCNASQYYKHRDGKVYHATKTTRQRSPPTCAPMTMLLAWL